MLITGIKKPVNSPKKGEDVFILETNDGKNIEFYYPRDNFLVYGGAGSGKTASIGKPLIVIIPVITIISDKTVANIGLLIKKFENIFYSFDVKSIEEPDFNLVKLFVITISPTFNPLSMI